MRDRFTKSSKSRYFRLVNTIVKGRDRLYRNAKAELVRAGLTLADVSKNLGGTISTWSLKLNGKYPITLDEARSFKRLTNSEKPLEELFEKSEEAG